MPYPIIMNGDHAEFELEHANTPPKERSDWPLPSFDAVDWAAAFCKIANGFEFKDSEGKPIDEGWMIGWFANALMRGFDEHVARSAKDEGDARVRNRISEVLLKYNITLKEAPLDALTLAMDRLVANAR